MPEATSAERSLPVLSTVVPLALFNAISWYLYHERLKRGEAHIQQTVMVLEEHAPRVRGAAADR